MKLRINIDLDNAAYEPPNGEAIGLSVDRVAQQIHDAHDLGPGDGGAILDVNGNTVGGWKITR